VVYRRVSVDDQFLSRVLILDDAVAWKDLAGAAVGAQAFIVAGSGRGGKPIAVAEARGDVQAAKEMKVFARRVERQMRPNG
jgi:hypothetical protein